MIMKINSKGMDIKRFYKIIVTVLVISTWFFTSIANGQEIDRPPLREAYLTPPESIVEEVMAPRHQNIFLDNDDLSPDSEFFINTRESVQMAPLSLYAKPYYNLAGLQVDRNSNRERDMTTQVTTGLELIDARTGERVDIDTPEGAGVTDAVWSPDGSRVAYFAHFESETHIYVTGISDGKPVRVTSNSVLATLNTDIHWAPDNRHLFTVLLPDQRGERPVKPVVPNTPQILKTTPEENRLRTYQSLLKDRNEAALFEYYTKGQLVRIDIRNGNSTTIGSLAMFDEVDPAPSGDYLKVCVLKKPFSYIVPYSDFAWSEQIWDLDGNMIKELRHSEVDAGIPDYEEIKDSNRKDIKWRPDGRGLSLIIAPTEEGGDNGNRQNGDSNLEEISENKEDEEKKYKVAQWLPPFGEQDIQVLYEADKEIESVHYNTSSEIFFIREEQNDSEHVYAVFADNPDSTYTIIDYNDDDFYDNPGRLVFIETGLGLEVVRTADDDKKVYLSGTQYYENYSEQAPRPFLDRIDIQSGDKERIFESASDIYEEVEAMLADDASELVIERQTATEHPDFWLHETATGDRTRLTENVDYNKAVTQTKRDRFKVKRADGFEFWVEVVLPSGWDGEPLPGIIWHYPREYEDQKDYDEDIRDYNMNDFPSVYRRTIDILVKRGYAVIDADWPIAAERGSPNEAFVWSIVQNSTAVLDSVEARGYIDRSRMAIGGHSYGAFGTANAMIHTSFFKAGIAGDGNYNRTLTPMGFQREPDDLWRGLDKYLEMSPIFGADRLDGALLMYHGEADQNVGTWPVHSKRMFHALNGIGKTAAMYMYPHEAHGPATEETMLDLWTRWSDWLDHYVKNSGDHIQESELNSAKDVDKTATISN